MENNLDELKDAFLCWEHENKINNYTIEGLQIWPFFRLDFFQLFIGAEDKISSIIGVEKSFKSEKTLKALIHVVFNSVIYLIKPKKKSETIFFSSVLNSVKKGEKYFDKYFDPIAKKYNDFFLLETPFPPEFHYSAHNLSKNRVLGDVFFLIELFFSFKKNSDTKHIKEILSSFTVLFFLHHKKVLETNEIESFVVSRINRSLERRFFFKWFLKKHTPKRVIVKSAYSPFNLVLQHEAKKLNIEFVEIQHSHIYPYHFGYIIGQDNKNNWYPDKILVFSEFYRNTLVNKCNWDYDKIEVIGNILLVNDLIKSNKYEKLIKKSNYEHVFTVVSQHNIVDTFIEFLKDAKFHENFLFIIKMHPKFMDLQIGLYRELCKTSKNIVLIEDDNISLESILNLSSGAIGVYSSGLIDAKMLNKSVFIINHPLSSFFKDFIDRGEFFSIDRIQNIVTIFNK